MLYFVLEYFAVADGWWRYCDDQLYSRAAAGVVGEIISRGGGAGLV